MEWRSPSARYDINSLSLVTSSSHDDNDGA